jgi:hypothetical protein
MFGTWPWDEPLGKRPTLKQIELSALIIELGTCLNIRHLEKA